MTEHLHSFTIMDVVYVALSAPTATNAQVVGVEAVESHVSLRCVDCGDVALRVLEGRWSDGGSRTPQGHTIRFGT